jgi:hypothetical protein
MTKTFSKPKKRDDEEEERSSESKPQLSLSTVHTAAKK